MTSEIIGAMDAASGGLLAAAVEPAHGQPGETLDSDCLNCGTALVGSHCHACGQKGRVHRTLHAFGHDFLHSVLHFDGKIWRTVPLLFWNPGELTRRYVHGERAKFVSPLALFLFSVFLTFAAFSWLTPSSSDTIFNEETSEAQYQADRKEILADLAELQADKKAADLKNQPGRQLLDDAIARQQRDLKALDEGRSKEAREAERAKRQVTQAKADSEATIARLEAELKSARADGKPIKAIEEKLEAARVDAKVMNGALAGLKLTTSGGIESDWTFTDPGLPGGKALNEAAKHAMENPQLLLYKIQSSAYKFSWALIPLSVPFVWLLFFWRRRFKMFDHAVFVTYSLTFMMLLGTVCAIVIQFPAIEWIGGLALAFYPPIHMYRQLHHAYETTRFGAFWRMCILSVFAMTALTLFAVMIVTLGITG
jgi:hypothetical protein